jgi:hypothetical protein
VVQLHVERLADADFDIDVVDGGDASLDVLGDDMHLRC